MNGADRRLSRITRRSLIGSGAVASALAVSGLQAGTATRRGGTLRIAAPPDLIERLVAPGAVFDTLTEIDGDGALRGALAETWETQNAGRDWTLRLRKDAAFHDGRPVTATDVLAALEPHVQPGGALGGVRRIRAAGEAVSLTLTSPDPQLPLRLADPVLVIRPSVPPRDTVGSGLYAVSEAGPGRLKLARVEGHGRAGRGGHFDRIELLSLDTPESRAGALDAGRVDLAFDLPASAGRAFLRHRRVVTGEVEIAHRGAKSLVGYTTRLRGMDGRDPLRIAERGHFA